MNLSSFAENATGLWSSGDGRELRIRRWRTTALRAQVYRFRFSARPFDRQHASKGKEIAMTTDAQKLSEEQKELVAVGASVGAGCHPCVSYHIKAGAKAGLSGDRLLAAVTSAERVAAEAAEAASVGATSAIGSADEASSCREEIASGQASDRTAGFAGPMAKLVGSAGAGDAAGLFAGMADCRAMFEGACAQLAAAQGSEEASVATLIAAGSTKED